MALDIKTLRPSTRPQWQCPGGDYITHGDSEHRLSPRYPTGDEAVRRLHRARWSMLARVLFFLFVVDLFAALSTHGALLSLIAAGTLFVGVIVASFCSLSLKWLP